MDGMWGLLLILKLETSNSLRGYLSNVGDAWRFSFSTCLDVSPKSISKSKHTCGSRVLEFLISGILCINKKKSQNYIPSSMIKYTHALSILGLSAVPAGCQLRLTWKDSNLDFIALVLFTRTWIFWTQKHTAISWQPIRGYHGIPLVTLNGLYPEISRIRLFMWFYLNALIYFG